MLKLLDTTSDAYKRMIAEKAELQKKVEALEEFLNKIKKGDIPTITPSEIELLQEQHFYMNGYLRVLGFRIYHIESNEQGD